MQRLLLGVFLLLCTLVKAQYTLKGTITNEKNVPLKNVHIHLNNKITTTAIDGRYSINNISEGNYKLYISYIGYEAINRTIFIKNTTTLNVKLFPSITHLDSVALNIRTAQISAVENEQKLNAKTIENYSNATLGDALNEIAGVSMLKTGATIVKPVINGLHGFRVPVINDNVKLEDQQWGVEHAPNLDINAANAIMVLKGASALQYSGDAIGGIVVVDPIAVKKDTLVGKTILTGATNGKGGSVSSSLTKGAVKGWAYNVVGTAKYFGDRHTPDYILSNTSNREQSLFGNATYTHKNYTFSGGYSFYNAQNGILKASHIGNVTDLYNAITNKEPYVIEPFSYVINSPKQETQHHLAKVRFEQKWQNSSKIDVQYAFQLNNRKEYDIRRNSDDNRPALDLDLMSHQVQANYKFYIANWKLKSGASFGYQNNAANFNTGVQPLIPNYNKIDFGVYTIANHAIDNSLQLETGLRYDFSAIDANKFYAKSRWNERGYTYDFSHFIVENYTTQWKTKPSFTYNNISGSVGFSKQFHHDVTWLFSIGLATRNPNVSELFSDGLHHATGQIELGNLRLQQESAIKLNTTVQKQWKNVTLEVNPFINRIANFMYLQPIGFETTIRGAFPVWEYKQTDAIIYGIDITGNWTINKHFSYSGNLAYLVGKNLDSQDYLIDMPPFNTVHTIQFKKNKFSVALKSESVVKQSHYPNFNFNTNIVVNGNLTPVTVDVSTPPNAYSLVHWSQSLVETMHF